jgi:hypothetical protein
MLFLNLPLAFERLMAFSYQQQTWERIGCPFRSSTLRIRNCGPPNSIFAVNLASRPLDAAAP